MKLGLSLGLGLNSPAALGEGGGGGEPDWWMEGALVDLDFENDRYYMGTERPLSEILTGDIVTTIGGLDSRRRFVGEEQVPAARPYGVAELISLVAANLPTGFTVFQEHTDDDGDFAPPGEFFGIYDIVDPQEADNGDAIELWWNGSDRFLGIDDWVNSFNVSLNQLVEGARNKSAVTLNVPQGGGNFKCAVCLNGGTVEETIQPLDHSTQHFTGPVQVVTVGWIAASDKLTNGIVHRFAILSPRSNAQMQTLTT